MDKDEMQYHQAIDQHRAKVDELREEMKTNPQACAEALFRCVATWSPDSAMLNENGLDVIVKDVELSHERHLNAIVLYNEAGQMVKEKTLRGIPFRTNIYVDKGTGEERHTLTIHPVMDGNRTKFKVRYDQQEVDLQTHPARDKFAKILLEIFEEYPDRMQECKAREVANRQENIQVRRVEALRKMEGLMDF